MKKKTRIFAALLSGILLLAGCADPTETPDTTTVPPTAAQEENTAAMEQTDVASAEASLVSLRQAMVETPQLFAVAYFGYHDTLDSDAPVDPYAVMREQAPELCENLPFLPEIPTERVIGNHGDLFCIVPLDADATVAVSKGTWSDSSEQYFYEKSLYFGNSSEPILLFCNNADFEPDTQLYISGPSGEIVWYPQADDNLCAMPLRNDNWDDLLFRFLPLPGAASGGIPQYERRMDETHSRNAHRNHLGLGQIPERRQRSPLPAYLRRGYPQCSLE